ncbi:MAG: HDOD domain-containing protein [Terriglobia bacterium]
MLQESRGGEAPISVAGGGAPKRDRGVPSPALKLPALPASVRELTLILSSDPVDLRRLRLACSSDPDLAVRIIGMSNSSLFGLSQPVSSVEQAVMMIGADHVRTLALACALVECMRGQFAPEVEQRFWRRAFLTAALSQRIAQGACYPDAETAYFAGLLHDIGMLPLLFLASHQEAGEAGDGAEDIGTLPAQRRRFGTDHSELGRAIGRLWDFPAALVEVFEFHEEPHRARHHAQLVHIVAAAAKLAAVPGRDSGRSPHEAQTEVARSQQLLAAWLPGMDSKSLASLAEVLHRDYRHVSQWLENGFLKAFAPLNGATNRGR